QHLWSKILNVAPDQIGPSDGFFALGGDSIAAMKLTAASRLEGYKLTVMDIFSNKALVDMAAVIKPLNPLSIRRRENAPFSLLHVEDIKTFLADTVRPALYDPTLSVRNILPV